MKSLYGATRPVKIYRRNDHPRFCFASEVKIRGNTVAVPDVFYFGQPGKRGSKKIHEYAVKTVQKKAAAKYDPDSDMPVADEFSDEG